MERSEQEGTCVAKIRHIGTFGLLEDDVVVVVYAERHAGPHIISLRKAEKHEARYYFKVAKDYFK